MAEHFLKLVATDLYNRFGNNLEDVIVVMPTKRPEYYFYQYLSQSVSNELIAPKVLTFNQLTEQWSDLTQANNIELVYQLYPIYSKHIETEQSFDDFYFWGELLLSDFSDIDNSLANAEEIFKTIKNIKQIENVFSDQEAQQVVERFWSTIYSSNQTTVKARFLKFWKALLPIYQQFNNKLDELKLAYKGKISRKAATMLNNEQINISEKYFAFVGFSYLNNAEKAIMQYLKKQNKALFYWDYDISYINKNFEAGKHIENNLRDFPPSLPQNRFSNYSTKKHVEIIEAPGLSTIAQIATQYLAQSTNIAHQTNEKTALVLADTKLLPHILTNIDESFKANITIGWNIKNSGSATFAKHILALWAQTIKTTDGMRFPVAQLLKIASSNGLSPEASQHIANTCAGHTYIAQQCFNNRPELLKIFICENQNISTKLLSIIDEYINKQTHNNEQEIEQSSIKFDIESANHLVTQLTQLANIMEICEYKLEPQTQIKLINRLIDTTTLSLNGTLQNNIQITGLSETNCLDFNNIVIAGANEGILPDTSHPVSHIPYSIRKSYGLSTFEDSINIEAYDLYRLVQRSENITFIINTDEHEVDNTEASRFVHQFVNEQSWIFSNNKSYSFQIRSKLAQPLSYPWSDKVSEYMIELQNRGISPTAINTYIDCPLKFYFKYPCKLTEPTDYEYVMNNRLFGDLLHRTIETVYKSFINKTVSTEMLDRILANSIIRATVGDISSQMAEINIQSGYNQLLINIIIEYIEQIIKIDRDSVPLQILGLEKNVQTSLSIETRQGLKNVVLKGKIDRIDFINGKYRVLDYKTGNPDISIPTHISALFDSNEKNRKKEALQTFTYAWIFGVNNLQINWQDIIMGLIISRKTTDKAFSMFHQSRDNQGLINLEEINPEFEANLHQVLSNIFDESNQFTQTSNSDNCRICPYKIICRT